MPQITQPPFPQVTAASAAAVLDGFVSTGVLVETPGGTIVDGSGS